MFINYNIITYKIEQKRNLRGTNEQRGRRGSFFSLCFLYIQNNFCRYSLENQIKEKLCESLPIIAVDPGIAQLHHMHAPGRSRMRPTMWCVHFASSRPCFYIKVPFCIVVASQSTAEEWEIHHTSRKYALHILKILIQVATRAT